MNKFMNYSDFKKELENIEADAPDQFITIGSTFGPDGFIRDIRVGRTANQEPGTLTITGYINTYRLPDTEGTYKVVANHVMDNITQVGKYVIGKVKEEHSNTRLFLYDGPTKEIFTKDGWHNIFTVSKDTKPLEPGTWLAKIDSIRKDKNGHPILVVEGLVKLNINVACGADNRVYKYLLSDHMATGYDGWISSIVFDRFNAGAVEKQYGSKEEILETLLNGTIDVEGIDSVMSTPTELEQVAMEIRSRSDALKQSYPMVYKKTEGLKSAREVMEWLDIKIASYATIPHDETAELADLEKAEMVIKYWDDIHAARKEAKKAEKKAKKAAVKDAPKPEKKPKEKAKVEQKPAKKKKG